MSNFNILYLADDSSLTVTIIRIIYSGRNLENVLKSDVLGKAGILRRHYFHCKLLSLRVIVSVSWILNPLTL